MTKTTKAALSDRSRFTVPTMGTVATITTPTPLPDSVKQKVAGELFRLEQLLSKFLPDSDISKLNRGGWAQVHPVTGRVLVATMDLAALSQGAFSPLIGRLAQLWDVKAYLAALAAGTPPPLPSEEAIAAARASCRPDLLEHGGGLRFRLREGSMLDLGGVAKGYAADRVRDLCEQEGIERA
ncbi:MAG: FAD:protein FMN transferase, partial [Winkia neuii]